jgi:hypothetical protein
MFRFKFTPASAGSVRGAASNAPASPLKAMAIFGLVFLALGIVGGWLVGRGTARPDDLMPDTRPIILAMQKIGQLHTASYNMRDVLRQESESPPEGWLRNFPGATGLYHWGTHNQALVVAEGTVEAGVDLTQLSEKDVTHVKQPDGTTRLRVHLPPVILYPPNVRVQVESDQSGLFWRDENIVPKAQAQASRLFLESAEKGNIRTKAQEGAIQTLRQMHKSLGLKDVEFYF